MKLLLDLAAAVSLMVWGAWLVRDGILRVYGGWLRKTVGRSLGTAPAAVFAGAGMSLVVQSSNAASLLIASFVGEGVLSLSAALAAVLGANVGTALTALLFSADGSWVAPLCLIVGTAAFASGREQRRGFLGRAVIGLGSMLMALRLIGEVVRAMAGAPAVPVLLQSLQGDVFLQLAAGAGFTVVSQSSMAIVLLVATLAAASVIPLDVSLGLVLGTNIGTALAAMLAAGASLPARRVLAGNLLLKTVGAVACTIAIPSWIAITIGWLGSGMGCVLAFHLAFNAGLVVLCAGWLPSLAGWLQVWMPDPAGARSVQRLEYLDESAMATPSLAISRAARAAMHQADVVETMLDGLMPVIRTNDLRLAAGLRELDDSVDEVCSAIKTYLARIPVSSLEKEQQGRWKDIVSFAINMEQIADIVENVLEDVELKRIRPGRSFSEEGLAEITQLHQQLMNNLRLSVTVFMRGSPEDAQKLLHEKARFRAQARSCSFRHIGRLGRQGLPSIETSSLHLDLINNLRRISSQLTAIAYPVLQGR